MVSGLFLQPKFHRGRRIGKQKRLDLNATAMAGCGFPGSLLVPAVDESSSTSFPLFLDETRSQKRLKHEQSSGDDLVSDGDKNSCLSCNSYQRVDGASSLPKLNFRDHVWVYTQRYLAIEAMEEAASALVNPDRNEVGEEGNQGGMRLLQALIACAEAVACRDRSYASTLLDELRTVALVFGTSFQRVASCFVQALSDRLSLFQPLCGSFGFAAGSTSKAVITSSEKQEALSLVYEVCPQIQFGHFVANTSILEAFEGESSVHVVDLGMTLGLSHGHQWRMLIDGLVKMNQKGQPPRHLRITGIGNDIDHLQAIGNELENYALSLGLDFEFSALETDIENLEPEKIKVFDGEVLVINSILELHCLVKESRGALNLVLRKLQLLSPKVFVLVEQDSSHNGPFFLGRFMEALHYYSGIFDSLDAMLPRYDTRRAKIEQFYFGEEIKNIVSCEGLYRVERHERLQQWRRRMSRAGFVAVPCKMMLAEAKRWLEGFGVCEGYSVEEDKGCLVLAWKSKPLIATSCWKCSCSI